MTEGLEELNKLTFFPKRIYPVRGMLLFLARSYYGIKHGRFAPTPNREGAATPSDD